MISIQESVDIFVNEKKDYFRQWALDEPFVFSKSCHDDLKRLQKIMYRLVVNFIEHYDEYKHLMPVSEKVEAILELTAKKSYLPGTYRTDFVFDENNQIRLIEITCRFALNGVFQTAIFHNQGTTFSRKNYPDLEIIDSFTPIYAHLEKLLAGKNRVVVLTGDDQKNESKIYLDIFKRVGLDTLKLNYNEVSSYLSEMKDALVISELSFDEICSLDFDVISKLIDLNIINDLRTIFLIHDKRFFSVLGEPDFLENVLSKSEIEFFKKFYIPTYTLNKGDGLWEKVYKNKNHWILKHRALGKSQSVYAGPVTDRQEWEKILSEIESGEFVVQKWVPQKTFSGTVKGEPVDDFITGTLLFFDDNYFGLGEFRTSSFPVTNKTDHRKAAGIVISSSDSTITNNINHYFN